MTRLALAGVTAVLLGLPGCGDANEHGPDQLLLDSLGLEPSDAVLRVEISGAGNREAARPRVVRVPVGGFVEFRTSDPRLHSVRFLVDSLPPAAADFLRSTGQTASPPLLELGARFVVTFRGAPEGRYPYVVEGNGETGRGAVQLGEGQGR